MDSKEPNDRGPLATEEVFYSAGPADGDVVKRYNTPTLERRNVVCERIRISTTLSEAQVQSLSNDEAFRSHFMSRQKAYVCETMQTIPRCGN
jgi:hypothetical protein